MMMKSTDKKRVNVRPTCKAIRGVSPMITKEINTVLTVGEILTCLRERAIVKEILDNNTRINLNFYNYKEDNNTKYCKKETATKQVSQEKTTTETSKSVEVEKTKEEVFKNQKNTFSENKNDSKSNKFNKQQKKDSSTTVEDTKKESNTEETVTENK